MMFNLGRAFFISLLFFGFTALAQTGDPLAEMFMMEIPKFPEAEQVRAKSDAELTKLYGEGKKVCLKPTDKASKLDANIHGHAALDTYLDLSRCQMQTAAQQAKIYDGEHAEEICNELKLAIRDLKKNSSAANTNCLKIYYKRMDDQVDVFSKEIRKIATVKGTSQ